MTKKIEFTDRAKEQIEKVISEDQLKKFFRILLILVYLTDEFVNVKATKFIYV